jgi:hypothetical protein
MSVAAQAPTVPRGVRELVEPLCRTRQQLEGTAGFLRWICTTEEARTTDRGDVLVRRSIPQMIRGMGLENGPTVHATRQRWRNQTFRWVAYLEPLGVTAHEAPRGPDGRGTCVIFTIPAGVAQSVKAAVRGVRRVAPRLRVPSFWNQVASPPTEATGVAGSSSRRNLRDLSQPARARTNPVVAPRDSQPATSVATLNVPRSATAALRAAVAAWREHTDAPWRLSAEGQQQLDRYCELMDRDWGPGAGQRWLVDAIHDTFDGCGTAPVLGRRRQPGPRRSWRKHADDGPRDGGPPQSLAYFVPLLRGRYRKLRKGKGRHQ